MKKVIAALLICILLFLYTPFAMALEIDYSTLTDTELNELIRDAVAERNNRQIAHTPEVIKNSPDKYTWYVQDYVGRNAASFGYTSLGGDRLERYGAGYLEFIFVTEDGMYLDYSDKSLLQEYIVIGQNIAPNTEMKYEFQKDSNGQEYSNLVDFQNLRFIDLTVKRIDGEITGDPVLFDLIPISPAPNRYTQYIRNYVGKNAASFGYTSLGGDRRDEYGAANILINFVSDDGTYIDPENISVLRQYIVTSQDIAPNTELKLTYLKDNDGNEYSNIVENMNYEKITLSVQKIDVVYPEDSLSSESEESDPISESVGTILNYQELQYRLLSDGNIEICGYSIAQSSMTIPSTIDNHSVTSIADNAFEDCTTLKNLTIWADLTYVGASAFKGCKELKEISIPSETTFIGESAFEGCSSLKTVVIWGEPIGIEKNTFKDCTRLIQISIPSSAKYISESAFENCTNLMSVSIWGKIGVIEKNAFKNCISLDQISIPSSCEEIGESAFQGCEDLSSVIFWGGTNIGNSAFRGCTCLEKVSINSQTEYIGEYAFEGCTSLEDVIIWGKSTVIGKDAFANCPKLNNVFN